VYVVFLRPKFENFALRYRSLGGLETIISHDAVYFYMKQTGGLSDNASMDDFYKLLKDEPKKVKEAIDSLKSKMESMNKMK
jgi:hypothetical protein